jgi:glutamine synthetase
MMAWSGAEDYAAEIHEMTPVGEYRLVPDPETFTILPYAPHQGSMMGDMLLPEDGRPWEACPRHFLKRMISRLAEQGLRMEAAVEHEFYLARETDTGYVAADHSMLFSTTGFNAQTNFITTVLEALVSQGITPELYHPEYGPAQQELSVHHTDALRAADNVCLIRETVRGIAATFGLVASFAPKPFLEHAGSGAHIHFSLWQTNGREHVDTNMFYDEKRRGGLSELGTYFLGGVMRHLRGLLALTCASPNSYARLQPHSWSSAYAIYGFDNREGAIRIPSLYLGREAASTNLELKSADHSGNPYLVLGGLLAAGIDGIVNRIEPGPSLDEDPGHFSEEELATRGIHRLPTSLGEALDELERDSVLTEALGSLLAKSYIAVKRNEENNAREKTPEEVALAYFSQY